MKSNQYFFFICDLFTVKGLTAMQELWPHKKKKKYTEV